MGEDEWKFWVCRCGQLLTAKEKPEPMIWDDGHVCHFIEEKREGDINGLCNINQKSI